MLPRNSVGANQIKSGGVGKAELKSGAVDSPRIRNNSVDSADLRNGRVASIDIADNGVASADIADGAVGAGEIADGSVGAAEIGDGAVAATELATGAVTAAKLAAGAVPAGTGPVARVSHSANVSVPVAPAVGVIPFNSEVFDAAAMHRTDVDPSRLSVTTPWVYLISANITWAPAAGAHAVEVNLRKNGTSNIARVVQQGDSANTSDQIVTTVDSLAAGDFVEVTVRQNSAAALNVLSAVSFSPQFSIVWLAPAQG